MTIAVVIADDDALMRAGLRVILASADDIEVVGEASDGLEALELCISASPDVVLMDVRMPGIDGIEATRRLAARHSETKVLILTTFQHDEYVSGALAAGASGFLLKRTSPERLIDAVRVIAAGDALLDPVVTRALIHRYADAPRPRRGVPERALVDQLTEREREVLTLIGEGLSNGEIADRLVIAESTAKTHVKRILAKVNARDRAQAVVLAYRSGLVS